MSRLTLRLSRVRILSTGIDGGHIYLYGRTRFGDEPDVRAYMFFNDKKQESAFLKTFTGQDLIVEAKCWSYVKGAGLNLYDVEYSSIVRQP